MSYYWILFPQISDQSLTLLTTIIIVGILIFMIILFYVFQTKKTKLLLKRKEKEQHFDKVIAQSQIEIREQTLKNISWELHDNIGQLITLAKIQIQNVKNKSPEIIEVNNTLAKSLLELRSLSKGINSSYIKTVSLSKIIDLELDRIKRLHVLDINYSVQGQEYVLGKEKEIVIFRILQEFFTNTLKYAEATCLDVLLNYNEYSLDIFVKDNGIGFNLEDVELNGIGINNIKERSKLIGAELTLESKLNKGTSLTIKQPI